MNHAVGRQEGHPACKNLGRLWGWGCHYFGWGGAHLDCRCLCLHFLPLLHKTQKIFPAYPGCPGQTAIKWLLLLLSVSASHCQTCCGCQLCLSATQRTSAWCMQHRSAAALQNSTSVPKLYDPSSPGLYSNDYITRFMQ